MIGPVAPAGTVFTFPGEDPLTGAAHIPEWVPKLLQVPESSISQVRIDYSPSCNYRQFPGGNGNVALYPVLLEYIAYHAVDLDQPYDLVESSEADNPKSNVRRVTGRLSSMYYAFNEGANNFSQNQMPDGCLDEMEEPQGPQKAILHFGLGKARVQMNGKEIGILHKSKGHPISYHDTARVFSALHLFAANTETIQEFADAALNWAFLRSRPVAARSGKFKLYTLAVDCDSAYWSDEGSKASRSLESIILPDGMLDAVVDDFKEFAADDTQEWYLAHGLPHRRSYLFYGPAGVGKTSTIRALAGALNLPACFLSLGNANIGNAQLQQALRSIPKKAMLVIEDIDALFNEDRMSKNTSLLTFSGLLNSLDGLVSAEGILTVMTTNHLERLDPALVRAGRVDRKFEFCRPTHKQIMGLFRSFYRDAPEELVREFADAVCKREEPDAKSIATLQEHFIFTRRKTARESIDSLDAFFTGFYPEVKRRQISQAAEKARGNAQVQGGGDFDGGKEDDLEMMGEE